MPETTETNTSASQTTVAAAQGNTAESAAASSAAASSATNTSSTDSVKQTTNAQEAGKTTEAKDDKAKVQEPKKEAAKGFLEEQGEEKKPGEEDKKADADTKKDAEVKPTDVPADGKYTFKLPDGFGIPAELEKDVLEFAKGTKLTHEQAQKMADFGVKLSQMNAAKAAENYQALQAQSIKNIQSDPDIGGANLKATQAQTQLFFKQTLERIPEQHRQMVKQYFIDGGAQNLEPVIRFMHAASESIREDKPLGLGNTSNPGAKVQAKYSLEGIREHIVKQSPTNKT